METTVTLLSNVIIKPSSATPNHLEIYKRSVLDRVQPPIYIPLLFFYQANESTGSTSSDSHRTQLSEKLKRSLSDTLTAFYPLAGKLDEENFSVDCNDAGGVKYVEARVHARLADTIQDPSTKQLRRFLPVSPESIADAFLLAVQVNFFDCGGIAIGVCLWHEIGDTVSSVAIVRSWAATCQGNAPTSTAPSFDLAEHIPDRDLSLSGSKIALSSLVTSEDVFVMKRLAFDKEKLARLRKAATSIESSSNDVVKFPSRVELVSSFIWKIFIHVAKSNQLNKTTFATQAVNLRSRMVQPHNLEHVFGNSYVNQFVVFDHDRGSPEIHDLVREFRNQVRAVNDDYIRKTQNGEDGGNVSLFTKGIDQFSKGGVGFCGFTSWCKFPVYEVDFGWGKPVWVGTTGFPLVNFTVLMDSKSEDGVEAYINTLPDNVELIESSFELL